MRSVQNLIRRKFTSLLDFEIPPIQQTRTDAPAVSIDESAVGSVRVALEVPRINYRQTQKYRLD